MAIASANEGPGSSPRAWGTRDGRFNIARFLRFIPTCVGNTSRCHFVSRGTPVHPHVRGEHARRVAAGSFGYGSSPRAWGTRPPAESARSGPRFIPTCVGNTRTGARDRRAEPVHPHVRGEHLGVEGLTVALAGSSPRAWGTRILVSGTGVLLRFIPTCVGNTRPTPRFRKHTAVHPHVRGEHEGGGFSLG